MTCACCLLGSVNWIRLMNSFVLWSWLQRQASGTAIALSSEEEPYWSFLIRMLTLGLDISILNINTPLGRFVFSELLLGAWLYGRTYFKYHAYGTVERVIHLSFPTTNALLECSCYLNGLASRPCARSSCHHDAWFFVEFWEGWSS